MAVTPKDVGAGSMVKDSVQVLEDTIDRALMMNRKAQHGVMVPYEEIARACGYRGFSSNCLGAMDVIRALYGDRWLIFPDDSTSRFIFTPRAIPYD